AGLLWVAIVAVAPWGVAGGAAPRGPTRGRDTDWRLPPDPAPPPPPPPFFIMKPKARGGEGGQMRPEGQGEGPGRAGGRVGGPGKRWRLRGWPGTPSPGARPCWARRAATAPGPWWPRGPQSTASRSW